MVVGNAKGAQSQFEEPQRPPRENDASLWLDREEGFNQVMSEGTMCQATEKHSKNAEGKKSIFEKINKIDKTSKTNQVKKGRGEH